MQGAGTGRHVRNGRYGSREVREEQEAREPGGTG